MSDPVYVPMVELPMRVDRPNGCSQGRCAADNAARLALECGRLRGERNMARSFAVQLEQELAEAIVNIELAYQAGLAAGTTP